MIFGFKRQGLTLIELLVAITILTIVSALVIPRVRLINKDRNIRETARVVGSVFASARERAIRDGSAGVIIERNTNLVSLTSDMNRVYFAGTRMFQLRSLPPYVGDDRSDRARVVTGNDVLIGPVQLEAEIPKPIENNVVAVGDFIQFDNNHPKYRISEVLPLRGNSPNQRLPLVLDWDNNPLERLLDPSGTDFVTNTPAPTRNTDMAFAILRQPKKIDSSMVDLPAGYILDLRYSGPFDAQDMGGIDGDSDTYTAFGLALAGPADPLDAKNVNHSSQSYNREIQINFDSNGTIDRVLFNRNSVLTGQSLYFFINEFIPSLQSNAQGTAESLLSNPDSLWLTIGMNGGANIGYNAPPIPDTVDAMISNARNISRNRTSASQ